MSPSWCGLVKFICSEKSTKFCEISTLLLSYVVPVISKVEILKKFVAFSGTLLKDVNHAENDNKL